MPKYKELCRVNVRKDIQVLSFIQQCKTMYCYRTTSSMTSTTSGTLTTCTPSSRVDWFRGVQRYFKNLPKYSILGYTWILERTSSAKYIHHQGHRALYSHQICNMDVRILVIAKRENPPTIKANKAGSTRKTRRTHFEEIRRAKYEETRRGNVDYRIQGKPHSTVHKEDSNRTATVKRHFELCEISSKIQCAACSLYWEAGTACCTCGKCMQPSERNRQLNQAKLDIFWSDGTMMTNTASLCQKLGGLRSRSFNMMKSHWKSEREILETFFECRKYSRTMKSAPWLWRGEANMQNIVSRIYSDHWKWKQTYPSRATSQTEGLTNNLKALRNTIIDLKLLQDGDNILLPQRIHLRHHDGNQAATCGQLGAGIRGNHHPGLNSEIFL